MHSVKTILQTILAGALLAACAAHEPEAISVRRDRPITFEAPIITPATRAPEDYPTDSRFTVWAKWHPGDNDAWSGEGFLTYMAKVNCAYVPASPGKGSWLPQDHHYYWPSQGKLNFVAVSPAPESSQEPWAAPDNATGRISTAAPYAFSAATAASQPDLMYSEIVPNKTVQHVTWPTPQELGHEGTYDGVQIPLFHALSKIVFKAKTFQDYSAKNYTVTLNSLVLRNVRTSGTFAYDAVSGTFQWTPQGVARENYTVLSEAHPGLVIGASFQELSTILLMPQAFDDNHEIFVKYTVTHYSSANEISVEKKLSALNYGGPATGFLPGHLYTFSMDVLVDDNEEILFAPTISTWGPVEVVEKSS